ncbi:MAG: DUF2330 domain-containing protein [Archangium sp.]|nr:DUF2330 domain-containing protein [Archangium sp.]
MLTVVLWSDRAEACGCFANSNTTVSPVIQAGERILFAVRDGKVIAHIQIQYSGDAQEFGWLLPLPAIPKLEVGRDELFQQLGQRTQPTYVVTRSADSCSQPGGRPFVLGCASYAPPSSGEVLNGGPEFGPQDAGALPPVAVVQSSVGPYDYAVLDASDKQAMITWLNDNRYFIPAASSSAVDRYVHPGAYFLALKLRTGKSAGDITPVVLEYPAAYPMIPIVLTSVGAQPNMGVQVWMLGASRAVPRNYHHVVINDAQLSWQSQVNNYSGVVTAAVAEAPQKHAFVTEYAGPSSLMKDVLVADPSMFGNEVDLAATQTPVEFFRYLLDHDFVDFNGRMPATVREILDLAFPVPNALRVDRGINQTEFINRLDYYLGPFKTQNPDLFANYNPPAFEPVRLAAEIFGTFVKPMRQANDLFTEFPILTRMYTTLSPEDMTEDPVFAFNPDLPLVPRNHTANIRSHCNGQQTTTTDQGWSVSTLSPGRGPGATRIEILKEEGQAELVVDNSTAISEALTVPMDMRTDTPKQGCTTVDPVTLIALAALVASRRRRR